MLYKTIEIHDCLSTSINHTCLYYSMIFCLVFGDFFLLWRLKMLKMLWIPLYEMTDLHVYLIYNICTTFPKKNIPNSQKCLVPRVWDNRLHTNILVNRLKSCLKNGENIICQESGNLVQVKGTTKDLTVMEAIFSTPNKIGKSFWFFFQELYSKWKTLSIKEHAYKKFIN